MYHVPRCYNLWITPNFLKLFCPSSLNLLFWQTTLQAPNNTITSIKILTVNNCTKPKKKKQTNTEPVKLVIICCLSCNIGCILDYRVSSFICCSVNTNKKYSRQMLLYSTVNCVLTIYCKRRSIHKSYNDFQVQKQTRQYRLVILRSFYIFTWLHSIRES